MFPRCTRVICLAAAAAPGLASANEWDVQTQATLQHDVTYFDIESLDGDDNAARRSRVSLKASSTRGVALKLEWDFASGTATDAYLDWSLSDRRAIKLGQFKQPFSLEELGSSRDLLLLERSLANDAFTIGRRVGVMWSQPAGRLRLEASAFFGTTEQISGTQGIALRLYAAEQSNRHVGIAVAVEQRDDGRLRQRARSESRLLPLNPLDTGSRSDVGTAAKIGLEGAMIHGSWTWQSELFGLRGQGDERPSGVGTTAQVSWASHGAERSIKNGVVKKPSLSAQPMVWELAARASHVEFDVSNGSLASQTQIGIGASLYLGTRWKLIAEQSYFDATRSTRLPRPGDVSGHFTSFRLQLAL